MVFSFLKENKQYKKLFLAGMINGMGDRFSQVAVLAMLLQITGSGFAVGITMALRLLPFLIFAPIGGRLADRFSRKGILVTTDLARILFALSFLLVNSKEDIWIVYVSSFVLAVGEAIYAPTRKASIPRLVQKKHLLKVNSLEQVMVGIVLVGGAFSGGVVSYLFGPNMTFWLNGISFLAAGWLISTITFPEKKENETNQHHEPVRFSALKKIIMMSVPLQIILLCEFLIPMINGIDNVLISVYAVEIYKLGDFGVGLFYGALGIGLITSFSVANRLKKHYLSTGLISLMLEGVLLILLSKTHFPILAFVIFCFTAFVAGIGNACFDTVLMNEISDEHQGSMFGLLATISNTMLGISMFLAGSALEFIEPRLLGFIGGISFIFVSLFLIFTFTIKKSRYPANE
ncbi:MFS transporter [Heyndrickxia sp. NPDC080065]|uniref:MFS transporter n=1 Tax=Heyndrickxia sp. NPDC080065 TaxID=3390568 RepID=UPI003D093519